METKNIFRLTTSTSACQLSKLKHVKKPIQLALSYVRATFNYPLMLKHSYMAIIMHYMYNYCM